MEIDLDKTQEWLNRTQAIRRIPPVRGGVKKDYRTIRQTTAFVLAALLCIPLLMLIPRPAPSSPKRIELSAALPALTDLSAPVVIPRPQFMPEQPERLTLTPLRQSTQLTNYSGTWTAPPRTDHIAPHAPIWLVSEPHSWYPEAATPQSAYVPHLPRSGIAILNR